MDSIIQQLESRPDASGQEPQYQAPMPEQKHFLNKKFIVTFVILLLLGVGTYGGIWYWGKQQYTFEDMNPVFTFTPRPSVAADPTADWKTYTNTQYGFTVKYPTDYRVNPFGQPTEKGLAVSFVQTGTEGTDLPSFFIWVIASTLSPDAWLKTTAAGAIVGDMTYHRITTYSIGQRTVVDASPTELGTHARVFSEGSQIVVFADVSGIVDPVPSAIQSFKFTK